MTDERRFRILVVDDEPGIRSGLSRALACDAYEVSTAADALEALAAFRERRHQLILLELRMPGPLSGLDLIRHVKEERPETLVIVVTAYGSIETAVEAMRLGALDYVTKPVNLGALRLQVGRAFEHHRLIEENRRLRDRLAAGGASTEIVGRSAAMTELLARLGQVADADITVMIEGESGTGKELVARALHDASHRRAGPFVAANIGALPESLVESELFGYEKGAFSGATRQKPGWFEMAGGGTLFLDEVGEMSAKAQVDLLRVLEQRELRRLGGERLIPVDVRLIVATNRQVDELVADGRLRTDLYYRLSVVRLRVPPLRERRDDTPQLVQHFLEQARVRHHREPKEVAAAAIRVLHDYPWPGNVRQLRNVIEQLVVTVEGPIIHFEDLPRELRIEPRHDRPATLEQVVQEAERAAILGALDQCNHHRERTAHLLGISVRTLHYKLNRYGLQ
jgi:two-component system NtrC family response regulator